MIPISAPAITPEVIDRLRGSPPTEPLAPCVTSVSDWIFGVTTRPKRGSGLRPARPQARLDMGSFAHKEMEEKCRWFRGYWGHTLTASEWDLIWAEGNHSSREERSFTSSSLQLSGNSVSGRPDVVLRHVSSGAIWIIERKFTQVPLKQIPTNGWPNLQLQLWGYSWLDEWADAPEVYLSGQIWRIPFLHAQIRRSGGLMPPWTTWDVATWWKRSDPEFDRSSRTAWKIAGGVWSGTP